MPPPSFPWMGARVLTEEKNATLTSGQGDILAKTVGKLDGSQSWNIVDILTVWDKMSGIISKISKSVKPPFPGSGILLAIFAIITISKTRLKNCFNFFRPWWWCFAKGISYIDFVTNPFQSKSDAEDKQRIIDELNATVAERQETINSLQETVNERDEEILGLRAEVVRERARHVAWMDELHAMFPQRPAAVEDN
ncbi:hypothetical protein FAGAP_5964 [Fusarium agapanthi]|uniref:Uncharacterized protein n=1 Tax=Fusarium agapanthi TaxID=1803897 RepID=A0A9P5B928_9HYPO|nr:hypothetical protein FAGAP_5964 [Fusarium agapanthi]